MKTSLKNGPQFEPSLSWIHEYHKLGSFYFAGYLLNRMFACYFSSVNLVGYK